MNRQKLKELREYYGSDTIDGKPYGADENDLVKIIDAILEQPEDEQ